MSGRDAGLVTSLFLLAVFFVAVGAAAETWRGLVVAPEQRCSPYDKKRHYPYLQTIEREIVRRLGAVYGPYTGDLLRFHVPDGHRAHRGRQRGA